MRTAPLIMTLLLPLANSPLPTGSQSGSTLAPSTNDGLSLSLIALPSATVTVRGACWSMDREALTLGGRGVHSEVGPEGCVVVECHDGRQVLLEVRRQRAHQYINGNPMLRIQVN